MLILLPDNLSLRSMVWLGCLACLAWACDETGLHTGPYALGEPCDVDRECESGICLVPEGGFCSRTCWTDDDCGNETFCTNLGAAGRWCLPRLCTPDCAGRLCGDDGCGGSCGGCPFGQVCEGGSCVACQPDCEHRLCGPDGCGGSCGDCRQGADCQGGFCICQSRHHTACREGDLWWFDSCGQAEEVSIVCEHDCLDGLCLECTADCADRHCGTDGCGGFCGDCPENRVCDPDTFTCVCQSRYALYCYDGDVWWFDSCGAPETLKTDCEHGCQDATCLECQADCADKQCGDDGCGGECGTCLWGTVCDPESSSCLCGPQATRRCYGDDLWWFDTCGMPQELAETCAYGCRADACLDCVPDCAGKQCGDDGCGQACATCEEPLICDTYTNECICDPFVDFACHDGDVWWFNSCGQPAFRKATCEHGCEDASCLQCDPRCADKECGDDGCGGECGVCDPFECLSGQCVCTRNDQCALERICIAGACELSYGRVYTLTVARLETSLFNSEGDYWDASPYSAPDPEICFYKNAAQIPDGPAGALFCTDTFEDRYYLTVDQGFESLLTAADNWTVAVFDMDFFGFHDRMDAFSAKPFTLLQLNRGVAEFSGNYVTYLTVVIEPKPE